MHRSKTSYLFVCMSLFSAIEFPCFHDAGNQGILDRFADDLLKSARCYRGSLKNSLQAVKSKERAVRRGLLAPPFKVYVER